MRPTRLTRWLFTVCLILWLALSGVVPAQAQLLGDLDSDRRPTVLDLTRLIGT